MSDARKPPRRAGRPTAGARAGERVTDYPQLSVRVPPEIKQKLIALSAVRDIPQWHIVADAIHCYFRDLSSAERARVHDRLRRTAASGERG